MATPSERGIVRIRRLTALTPTALRPTPVGPIALGLAALGLAALLGACTSQAPASHPVSAAAVHTTCTQVSAVLSDGPDPVADPVGYAEAQILPLDQIRTSDAQLRAAISKLAGAYRSFFATNGSSSAAKVAVATASKQINALCPGAAS
jgi:hypothetical protein